MLIWDIFNRLSNHLANKANPHSVTASQLNALSREGGTVTGNLAVLGINGKTYCEIQKNVYVPADDMSDLISINLGANLTAAIVGVTDWKNGTGVVAFVMNNQKTHGGPDGDTGAGYGPWFGTVKKQDGSLKTGVFYGAIAFEATDTMFSNAGPGVHCDLVLFANDKINFSLWNRTTSGKTASIDINIIAW